MTDMMREMIAQLMGAQREKEEGRVLPPYHSRQVCRLYLIGCCPREKLLDTRLEPFVTCRKLHEPAHHADYQRAQEQRDHFYDVEAFDEIEHIIRVVDGEVEKIKEKVQRDAEGQQDTHEFMKSAKVTELTEKINQTLTKVEELGNEGKVQESMDLAKSVEDMKRRKAEIEAELKAANPATQRLRVCDDCGAQLNVLDHESRLADHYGGRMHLGMVELRDWFKEKKETIEERREAKRKQDEEAGPGPSGSRQRSRSPIRNRSPRRYSPDRYDRDRRYGNDRRDRFDHHRGGGGNRDWRDRDDRGGGRFRDDRRERYQDRRDRERTDRRRRY
uniref:C2H2-type domain-containing protein n=1 Tax=Panagrellus redivivus TaxID=6233 RepID=A0A7E4VJ22_PANRE